MLNVFNFEKFKKTNLKSTICYIFYTVFGKIFLMEYHSFFVVLYYYYHVNVYF